MEDNEQKPSLAKRPWPTKDAMMQVYQKHLWGGEKIDFYSGVGSHHPEIIGPYLEALVSFLSSFEHPLVICDLGCGDFNIGKDLVKFSKHYIGVDIVPELIARNKKIFTQENLEFYCLDIAKDHLPLGDCAIIRQVLQHLSNDEVMKILHKLIAFTYVVVTEHVPVGNFVPNKDIISGQGIRLKKQSGVNVLAAPFNLKIKTEKLLTATYLGEGKGVIETTLYQLK